jgi:arylsulfatase A-like enzyme
VTGQNGLSRRQFLQTAGIAAVAGPHLVSRPAARRPNLLFLWTDEQRADTMAAYGNTRIKTPCLNKLAGESAVFANAYVSQPVCTPSRMTAMTGLWPHQTPCCVNNAPLPAATRCHPELLNDPDYRTGYMGKWHLGDEIFAQHGFGEWVSIEDGYRKHFSPGRDRTLKSDYWHFLEGLGYKPDEDGYYSRNFAAHRPVEHCKPKFLETKAVDFLRRHQNDPFVLSVNFLEPHMPYYGPLNDLHDPAALDLPPNFDDPLEDNEPLRYRLLRQKYIEQGSTDQDLHSEAGWRRIMANYYGLVAQVDRSVGAILAELERLGLADNTIVVYTSDHGDMMGSHRLLAKTVMYEESVRVPWLMRVPGLKGRSGVLPGRYSHIDLVPTLLDLMGAAPGGLPGKSLVPVLRGERGAESDVFIQWNGAEGELSTTLPGVTPQDVDRVKDAPIRTVITQDGWKLCLCEEDKSQLFDLNTDPYETRNLYGEESHADRVRDLSRRIRDWQKTVKDSAMTQLARISHQSLRGGLQPDAATS